MRKIWVWVRRFRQRKGYGVHSPFAFTLIRNVINEKTAYYAYAQLKPLRREYPRCPRHVDQLLFRLANRFQPKTVVQVGSGARISLRYMAAGCMHAYCVAALPDEDEVAFLSNRLWQREGDSIDLLHITFTEQYAALFEAALPFAASTSLFVVERIHESDEKLAWWRAIQQDERVGITFDLYELGLVFFDRSRYKQHYVVNFN